MFFLSLFTRNNLPLAISKKVKIFFFGKPICFCKQPEFWTFWETLLFQVHFAAVLLPLRIFEKKSGFFSWKTQLILKKNHFLNVSGLLHFQSLSTASFLLLVIKKAGFYWKYRCIFSEKAEFWTFRKILFFPSHSTANLLPWAI